MSDILALPRPRINASMLSRYISKPVCFVGRVEKVTVVPKTQHPVLDLTDVKVNVLYCYSFVVLRYTQLEKLSP